MVLARMVAGKVVCIPVCIRVCKVLGKQACKVPGKLVYKVPGKLVYKVFRKQVLDHHSTSYPSNLPIRVPKHTKKATRLTFPVVFSLKDSFSLWSLVALIILG